MTKIRVIKNILSLLEYAVRKIQQYKMVCIAKSIRERQINTFEALAFVNRMELEIKQLENEKCS